MSKNRKSVFGQINKLGSRWGGGGGGKTGGAVGVRKQGKLNCARRDGGTALNLTVIKKKKKGGSTSKPNTAQRKKMPNKKGGEGLM